MEPSTVKGQHLQACKGDRTGTGGPGSWNVEPFPLSTFRHTCLPRWARHVDPWTLAHLAGHRDMNITKRYVYPQEQTVRAAMDRAQVANAGHAPGHIAQNWNSDQTAGAAASNN